MHGKLKLRLLAAALVCAGLWGSVAAQTFPARPITLVVPFPPGGVTDPLARFVGQKVSTTFCCVRWRVGRWR